MDEGLTCTKLITYHDLSFCIGLFDSRVLRRISRTKRQKLTRGCRKVHNEEIHKKLMFFTKFYKKDRTEADEMLEVRSAHERDD